MVALWRVGKNRNEGQEFVNRPEVVGETGSHSGGTRDPTPSGLGAGQAEGFVGMNQIVDHIAPEGRSH